MPPYFLWYNFEERKGKMMKRAVKSVDITLENCESYEFDAKDISVRFKGLGRSLAYGSDYLTAEETEICINKEAKATGGWGDGKWQNRIHKDITQIHINYTDGTSQGYFVNWGEGEYENEYETDEEDQFHKIYIISKKK